MQNIVITLRGWRGAEQARKGVRKHRGGGGGHFGARQYGASVDPDPSPATGALSYWNLDSKYKTEA